MDNDVREELARLTRETIALQTVCALLLAKMAAEQNSPSGWLETTGHELLAAVGATGDTDIARPIAEIIERLISTAEAYIATGA
jgi:hypothetical protein